MSLKSHLCNASRWRPIDVLPVDPQQIVSTIHWWIPSLDCLGIIRWVCRYWLCDMFVLYARYQKNFPRKFLAKWKSSWERMASVRTERLMSSWYTLLPVWMGMRSHVEPTLSRSLFFIRTRQDVQFSVRVRNWDSSWVVVFLRKTQEWWCQTNDVSFAYLNWQLT